MCGSSLGDSLVFGRELLEEMRAIELGQKAELGDQYAVLMKMRWMMAAAWALVIRSTQQMIIILIDHPNHAQTRHHQGR